MLHRFSLIATTLLLPAAAAFAQQAPATPMQIDLVAFGGNDCPPCMLWRGLELPKLQAMPEYKLLRYTHVTKSIQSPVPAAFFFPSEIRHLQPVLKEASNGYSGSPHQAILVNGKVVDYWFGTGSGKSDAHAIAAVVRAIHDGTPMPRKTCLKLKTQTTCAEPGSS
jgi:hypothetical protein